MPTTLIRLAVALLTFGLGVSATMFWIAYSTPEANDRPGMKFIKISPRHAHPPPPLPPLPTVEAPPPPAPPRSASAPVVSGGIIDGKALSKPAPVYPSAAVAAGVSGTVHVRVLLDESGRVSSANAISGDRLLREAAAHAATQARFPPTLLEGRPVRVSGVVSYNFVLP